MHMSCSLVDLPLNLPPKPKVEDLSRLARISGQDTGASCMRIIALRSMPCVSWGPTCPLRSFSTKEVPETSSKRKLATQPLGIRKRSVSYLYTLCSLVLCDCLRIRWMYLLTVDTILIRLAALVRSQRQENLSA